MRVLVCGGRDYNDARTLHEVLAEVFHTNYPVDFTRFATTHILIEGGAKGADALAREWAVSHGMCVATVNALWDIHGKRAGFLRNNAMLMLQPDKVVAFPGGRGTQMMIELAKKAGVEVDEIQSYVAHLGGTS